MLAASSTTWRKSQQVSRDSEEKKKVFTQLLQQTAVKKLLDTSEINGADSA